MRWANRLWRDLVPETPLTVTVHRDGDTLRAEVEELPGCSASGDSMQTLQEALAHAISEQVSEPGHPAQARIRFWQKIGEVDGNSDVERRIDVLVN
ncbi:MAG TPA: hypothetical protein VN799_01765 [Acidimicrobiales bacterium]|nr:hypothetical protein [Acidimicrobiales bacterium]